MVNNSDGDGAIFALLHGNREDLDRLESRVSSLEKADTQSRIDTARSLGQLEQGNHDTTRRIENLLERLRGVEQAHATMAAKHEEGQLRVSRLDRELHGQVVRLQTIGAAIGAFLTIAQAIQFVAHSPLK